MKRYFKSEKEVNVCSFNISNETLTIRTYYNDCDFVVVEKYDVYDVEDLEEDFFRFRSPFDMLKHSDGLIKRTQRQLRNPFFSSKTGKPLSSWFDL